MTAIPQWIDFHVVDAFSKTPFSGNPAGVVVIDPEQGFDLTLDQRKAIAAEINLAETAFVTRIKDTPTNTFHIQWITPSGAVVDLCGHATLASTSILAALPAFAGHSEYHFQSDEAGTLVGKVVSPGIYELDFPASVPRQVTDGALISNILAMIASSVADPESIKPRKMWRSGGFLFVQVETVSKPLSELEINPAVYTNIGDGAGCAVLTTLLSTSSAPFRFHSRFFGPDMGIPEDVMTGSAHCVLPILWGAKSGEEVWASQGGKRKGEISTVWDEAAGRMKLRGYATTSSEGRIRTP